MGPLVVEINYTFSPGQYQVKLEQTEVGIISFCCPRTLVEGHGITKFLEVLIVIEHEHHTVSS